MFQSTHPRRVWQYDDFEIRAIRVSIHTPTKGVTANGGKPVESQLVSIHTPTKGVTRELPRTLVNLKFQSTHPRRVWPYNG